MIHQATSNLYHQKADYALVGAAAEPIPVTSASSSVFISSERKALSRHLFLVTFGMTTLFMVPSYLWYACVAMTSMANLTAIYNTACFFAYLFSVWLLREKIVMNKVVAVFLSLLGVAIISLTTRESKSSEGEDMSSSRGSVSMIGDVLALVGAALYGFEEVIYKKYASPKVHSITFANTLTGLMGVVTCTMLWVPIPLFHWMGHEIFELPTLHEALSILLIATLGLIYNGCFMVVVSQTSPVFAAVGVMATIPLVAFTDWVLFGESVGWGNIKLAPKLNGGSIVSKQNASGNHPVINNGSNSTSRVATPSKEKVQSGAGSSVKENAGIQAPLGSGFGSNVQGPGSIISRQTNPFANPFAKGFSALRNSSLSSHQPPINNTTTVASTTSTLPPQAKNHSSTITTNNSVTKPLTENGALVQEKSNQITSVAPNRQSVSGQGTTSQSTSDGNISLGADDFLLGDDMTLMELMGDLDGDKVRSDDLPLSWTPTPPKYAKPGSASLKPSSEENGLQQKMYASRVVSDESKGKAKAPNPSITIAQASIPTRARSVPTSSPGIVEPLKASLEIDVLDPAFAPVASTSTSLRSGSKRPLESSVHSNFVSSVSQGSNDSRPDEWDTIDRRDYRGPPRLQSNIKDIKEQEKRGLSRSISSPSSGLHLSNFASRNKRRLPGPAGNLPKLSAEEKEQLFRSRGVPFGKDTRLPGVGSISPNSSIKKKMKAVAHGPIDSMFATGAWEEMLRLFKLPDYKPSTLLRFKGTAPMIEFSISDIENRRDLHQGKVSGLLVMIKEVSLSEIDAAVILLDPSGEMPGTIHRTVLEQYKNNEIRVGTVLALKNVSVFSPTPVSHYLIITLRNIVGIFQPQPPTIILSQGSSQDRLSQKRKQLLRRGQGSHGGEDQHKDPYITSPETSNSSTKEGQVIDSSQASSDGTPNQILSSLPRRGVSPEWDVTHQNESSKRIATVEDRDVLSNKRTTPSSSQNDDKKQQQNTSPLSSQQLSQTQEVQFQSLRQTFGGASMTPVHGIDTRLDDVSATPIITLGALTPDVSVTGGSSNGGSSSLRLLSSFAASPELRKRTSPSSLNRKTRTLESASRPEVGKEPKSELTPTEDADETRSIDQPGGSSDPVATPRAILRSLSSSDWPDDFAVDDFDVTLDEDTSTIRADLQTIESSRPNVSGVLDVRPAMRRVSNSRPMVVGVEDRDEDDFDSLLDGLDETELYDL
ncbi:hypothetical protein BGZ51_002079 [Haplosporangium sp. Z 767]|nr:hypothetical protein BGZ51_002079 [Haplosporangium sp. Z 767]